MNFILHSDQVDYTHARWAPVINCVLTNQGKILIVKRNEELNFYPGYWNGISGFLDDAKSLEEKVKEEIQEETGIEEGDIKNIVLGEIFHKEAVDIGKTWIIHPIRVEVSTRSVRLDWEGAEYRWIDPQEASSFKCLPGFYEVLKRVCKGMEPNL